MSTINGSQLKGLIQGWLERLLIVFFFFADWFLILLFTHSYIFTFALSSMHSYIHKAHVITLMMKRGCWFCTWMDGWKMDEWMDGRKMDDSFSHSFTHSFIHSLVGWWTDSLIHRLDITCKDSFFYGVQSCTWCCYGAFFKFYFNDCLMTESLKGSTMLAPSSVQYIKPYIMLVFRTIWIKVIC